MVEEKQGSFSLRGLLERAGDKRKQREEEGEAKAKRAAVRAEKKQGKEATAEAARAAWVALNPSVRACPCYFEGIFPEHKCKDKLHYCINCKELKSVVCTKKTCISERPSDMNFMLLQS